MKIVTDEREEFYDTRVAPLLIEARRDCFDNGMGMLAVTEARNDGVTAHTLSVPEGCGDTIKLLMHLSECIEDGEIKMDKAFMALIRHAQKHGHSSIIMQHLEHTLDPRILNAGKVENIRSAHEGEFQKTVDSY